MKVLQLKGHERGLNCLKFNSDGDLLFTCSKDSSINCWYTEDGVRVGTYQGHTGAIWDLDVDRATERLFSASSDMSVRMWECETGKPLFQWKHKVPVRSVALNSTEEKFLSCTDNVMGHPSALHIFRLADDARDIVAEPFVSFVCGSYKVTRALWGPNDEKIFTVGDSTKVHIWDAETQQLVHQIEDHSRAVNSIEFSQDGCFFLTGSSDYSARLYDTRSYAPIKTYLTGRPCNGASLSPSMDHVFIGGGQPASEVTGTRTDPAQFATRIFHKIWAEEMGMIPGHFGTVNAVKCSPNGRQLATGGEDGYIRLNFLDDTYFRNYSDEAYLHTLTDRLHA